MSLNPSDIDSDPDLDTEELKFELFSTTNNLAHSTQMLQIALEKIKILEQEKETLIKEIAEMRAENDDLRSVYS